MVSFLIAMIGQQSRQDTAPEIGAVAPPVVAKILGSERSFDMGSNKGRKITVLVFGSCT